MVKAAPASAYTIVSFVATTDAVTAALAVAVALKTLRGIAVAVTAVADVALVDLVAPAGTVPAITLICAASAMPI